MQTRVLSTPRRKARGISLYPPNFHSNGKARGRTIKWDFKEGDVMGAALITIPLDQKKLVETKVFSLRVCVVEQDTRAKSPGE